MTLLNLDVRKAPPVFYTGAAAASSLISLPSGLHGGIAEHPNETDASTDAGMSSTDGGKTSSDIPRARASGTFAASPAFGEGNTLLVPASTGKEAGKRRKPKNNMTKSNSSFISRVIVHETLTKRLQDRPHDGLFAFANINRAFQWLDMSSPTKVRGIPCKEDEEEKRRGRGGAGA